jgi:hypothetical protein
MAYPLAIKNLKGIPNYHMILATDNPAGTNIMSDLYTEALAQQSTFRQERLFGMELEVEAFSTTALGPHAT